MNADYSHEKRAERPRVTPAAKAVLHAAASPLLEGSEAKAIAIAPQLVEGPSAPARR